jgi:hypothetical protein
LKFWLDWNEAFLREVGDAIDVIRLERYCRSAGLLFHPQFYRPWSATTEETGS